MIMTQSLTPARNALKILKAFTPEQAEWGVRELSSPLGWSRSTPHFLLTTLASEGFLIQFSDRRYRLGWAIFELGSVFLSGLELLTPKPDDTLWFFKERLGMEESGRQGQSVY